MYVEDVATLIFIYYGNCIEILVRGKSNLVRDIDRIRRFVAISASRPEKLG